MVVSNHLVEISGERKTEKSQRTLAQLVRINPTNLIELILFIGFFGHDVGYDAFWETKRNIKALTNTDI